ncbi:MAG: PAS domain-containing protein [Trichocoleus desertorum ATA4-8-CV12]|jgi:PAS domain S-box-containing protein|nr:PAS domain-containing protein [Trichocoleus desertorum ATA4-8-CV12]
MPQNLSAPSDLQREELCYLFVKNLPFAAALLDRDMNYLITSQRWLSDLRLDQQDIIGRSHYEFFPQHCQPLSAAHQHCLAENTELCVEEQFQPLDQAIAWRQWKICSWQDKVGAIGGVMLVAEDITQRKQAEAALRENEAELQAIIDNCPAIIYLRDTQGRLTRVNRQFEILTGMSAEQICGKSSHDLFPKHVADEHWKNDQILLATGQAVTVEELAPQADGLHTYLSVKFPIFNSKGEVSVTGGISTDISDRKQAEQALKESEALYRQMLDAIPDMVLCKGERSRIIYGNEAFRNFYGRTNEELQGLIDSPVNDPDYTQQYIKDDLYVFSTGQTLNIPEEPVTRHDGSVRLFHTIKTPIFDAAGNVVQTMGVSRDITERKQADIALQQGKHQLEEAQRLAHIGSWDFDPMTGVISWSDEVYRVHGLPVGPKAPSYAELLQMYHPSDRDLFQEAVTKALTEGAAYEIEYRIIQPTGSIRHIHAKGEAILNEQGETVRLFGTIFDITDRKQFEVALKQSEARLREKAQREQLLNQLTNQIRSSLNLNQTLEAAVREIQSLLQLDRCLFVRYRQHIELPYWEITQEAKDPALKSFVGSKTVDADILPLAEKALRRAIVRIDDVQSEPDPTTRQFFTFLGYTAMLTIPIHTQSGEIGIICCVMTQAVRTWDNSEVALLQVVGDNLAIAIDQAKLYEQSRAAAATAQAQTQQLEQTLRELQQTQAQLVQTEKMSSLGQLVAGVAHEINNPVNFIYGNLSHADEYMQGLLHLLDLYQQHYPQPHPEIQQQRTDVDIEFLSEDLPRLLSSMKVGADRIQKIVLALRNFSRMDEAEVKSVNVHEGIDSTLMILHNRIKDTPNHRGIEIIKTYDKLPLLECYAGQLNQVFMNVLSNAIDALNERDSQRSPQEIKQNPSTITIQTRKLDARQVQISIADNGPGMPEPVRQRLFEPFFTTKPIGKGTGLGLSISYQVIVEKHLGQLECISAPGQGAEFLITLPLATKRL